ncbi:MAG: UDP-N-acetylmuramate--L-alanine ligase [Candidatus Omnitrophica bacterium]|nr:UDP-N-acetylmuramate--L-alanine ligase [Candidatus Omnitrophota bacterium]
MHYHFIGIGGIGMSGIARLVLQCGKEVSGSDVKNSALLEELKAKGAKVFIGHDRSNVEGADVVVYSSAVSRDNPELSAARKMGVPVLKRAEALCELMKDKTVVTVSGSHGKTTTTSLVSYLLMEAGLSPTAVIGGIFRNIDANVCFGKGSLFVAEADESDGSFLHYLPKYSIVTNIDREHLDYYNDFSGVLASFKGFLDNTEEGGCIFACYDDNNLKRLVEGCPRRHVFFGLDQRADVSGRNIRIEGLSSSFDCYYKGKSLGNFQLALGGEHNISNALAVIALGMELKIDLAVMRKVFSEYKGAKRRLEVKFQDGHFRLIDDYAHHPTEIKATLSAAEKLGARRLVAVFQPHRYSRTKLLLDDFARSFGPVDRLIITDIYAASEPLIEGVNKEALCARIKELYPDKNVVALSRDQVIPEVLKIIEPGDLLLTLGAGDITRISDELASRLAEDKAVSA